jgi:hypothetical protein
MFGMYNGITAPAHAGARTTAKGVLGLTHPELTNHGEESGRISAVTGDYPFINGMSSMIQSDDAIDTPMVLPMIHTQPIRNMTSTPLRLRAGEIFAIENLSLNRALTAKASYKTMAITTRFGYHGTSRKPTDADGGEKKEIGYLVNVEPVTLPAGRAFVPLAVAAAGVIDLWLDTKKYKWCRAGKKPTKDLNDLISGCFYKLTDVSNGQSPLWFTYLDRTSITDVHTVCLILNSHTTYNSRP